MTLLFLDGMDHYDDAQVTDKYDAKSSTLTVYPTSGRFGSGSIGTLSDSMWFRKTVPKCTDLYVGAAFNVNGSPNNPSQNSPLIQFSDENLEPMIQVHTDTAQRLRVYDRDTWTLLDTTTWTYTQFTWYYLEMRIKVHATAGEFEIRINEQVVSNLSGIDTKDPSGSGYVANVRFSGGYFSASVYWDDLYIDDAQFHGACRINTYHPDSDETHSDWTRSTGSNDYECVDEDQTNDDTDYISSSTKGHKSTFGFTTGALNTIKGLQVTNHCRASASGIRRVKALVRSGGSDYRSPVSAVISSDYRFQPEIFATDPQDSNAWNQTKIEAAEFGVELVAGTTTTTTSTTTTTT